jgi:hypothetical protein
MRNAPSTMHYQSMTTAPAPQVFNPLDFDGTLDMESQSQMYDQIDGYLKECGGEFGV